MNILKINLLLVPFLFTAFSHSALSNEVVSEVVSEDCAAALNPAAAYQFADALTGIGHRGFLGQQPALSADAGAAASKHGIMYWGQRIYILESLEQAQTHDLLITNPLMKGVYLISQTHANPGKENSPQTIYDESIEQGFYWFKSNGQRATEAVRITAEELARYQPEAWEHIGQDDESHNQNYIIQNGWFFPKQRGAIAYANTAGSTYKKLRQIARKYLRATDDNNGWGFSITFNQDFAGAVKMLSQQQRKGQGQAQNRFDEELQAELIARYEQGEAFSVEVRNAEGKIVGGNIGYISGAVYSPDSVFYDNVNYDSKVAITFAKISVIALLDKLYEAGIDVVDAGMVTPFTASLKGKHISAEDFVKVRDALPESVDVDWNSPWTGSAVPLRKNDAEESMVIEFLEGGNFSLRK